MGIHEGSAQLNKSLRALLQAWEETRSLWNDPVSRSFEERFLTPLQADARRAAEALSGMAGLLDEIRQECT